VLIQDGNVIVDYVYPRNGYAIKNINVIQTILMKRKAVNCIQKPIAKAGKAKNMSNVQILPNALDL
jgi:hypothetical protein